MLKARWRLVGLLFAVVFVAVVAHHPHWNPASGVSYAFPRHADEYVHWGYADAVVRTESIRIGAPFGGGEPEPFSIASDLHERGFHIFLAAFHEVTGVSWLKIFEWGPAALAVLTALAAFVFLERYHAGLEGAILVAAIPTTLRFLGPGFLVPIAASLPLVIVGMIALSEKRDRGGLVVFVSIVATLWLVHAIAAVLLTSIGIVVLVSNARATPRRSLVILALLAALLVFSWPYYSERLARGFDDRQSLPHSPREILMIGFLPLFAAAIGTAALVASRDEDERTWGAALGIGAVGFELVLVVGLIRGSSPFGIFDRSVAMATLLVVLLAAVGFARAARFARGFVFAREPRFAAFAAAAILVLPAAAALESAHVQFGQEYYELLTAERFDSFVRADGVLQATHGLAAFDGADTMPFTILTGFVAMVNVYPGGPVSTPELVAFFEGESSNTTFLVQSGATVVVTHRIVNNPDLVLVVPGVYELRPEIVATMPVRTPRH